MTKRHKVFVSYYHKEDQMYRNDFENLFAKHFDIMVSKSVEIGDIDPNLKTETVHQKIRDEYIRDATVTVVLVGRHTWQRKHVDWEIYSSLRNTEYNPRCGLLGILLPSRPDYNSPRCNPGTIPPRLYENIKRGYAKIYNWSNDPSCVSGRIHEAFEYRHNPKIPPDLSRPLFANNHSGDSWQ